MVGGGQLARMTHGAALDLDVELVVLDPDPAAPAVRAGARHLSGTPSSPRDLSRLATRTDVVSFDHERVAPAGIAALERAGAAVRPPSAAKALAQDKLAARQELASAGIRVPRWAPVRGRGDLERIADEVGWPLILKARSGGYDGRGVWEAGGPSQARTIFERATGSAELIAEERVPIVRELAVLVARRPGGEAVCYPPFETVQRNGICRSVSFPAGCDAETGDAARELGVRIAELAGASGIVCVELFETADGLLVNELAMRPHNSGHLTLDACETSQFHNHLRAVLDWPLGSASATAPAAAMVNVLGPPDGSDPAARLPAALRVPGARVRLYGKAASPGRKLGHVTALAPTPAQALERAREAAEVLSDA